ncbi:MAG: glycosyltransferase family 39 protein [Desulfobacteraceae bacterium]|nr:glycosyltransferase family 39 protein [Desulfobacteraceae bacterium]
MEWNRRFYILLAATTALRFAYLFLSPLDLVPDEAYYWDWSRQLDWGYYSKPPLIAWIIALSTRTLGSSAAMVRLPAVLLGAIGLLAVFLLARRMYDSRTGFWAAVASAASPGSAALGFIMTIDAPLVVFWCCALYLFWRGIEGKSGSVLFWCGLSAAIGLGLLSKQMMAVFIVLMFLFFIVSREDRHHLGTIRPYLFSGLSLLALLPPLWWNTRHGWITLQHTAHHFEGARQNFIATFGDFIGGQLLVVSPVTWVLFAVAATVLLFRIKSLDRRARYLLCFSIASLIVFLIMSFRQKIQPNWPAAYYPAGMILLAAWACGHLSAGPRSDAWRRYFRQGTAVGAVIALLVYILPFVAAAAPSFPGARAVSRLQGWQEMGRNAARFFGAVPAPGKTFVLSLNRQITSELAFYMPGQPRVYSWRFPNGIVTSQYDIWDGPPTGLDALIVVPAKQEFDPERFSEYFESIEKIGEDAGTARERNNKYFLGKSLRRWPGLRPD